MDSVTIADVLLSESPMALNPDFDGACPCNTIKGQGFDVEIHCWRTSRDGCLCHFSGVHVSGLPDDVGRQVAEHVRDNSGWAKHTDWTLVINGQSSSDKQ